MCTITFFFAVMTNADSGKEDIHRGLFAMVRVRGEAHARVSQRSTGGHAAISKRCARGAEVSRRTAARRQRCHLKHPPPRCVPTPYLAPHTRTRLSHTNTGDSHLRNSTPNRKVAVVGI